MVKKKIGKEINQKEQRKKTTTPKQNRERKREREREREKERTWCTNEQKKEKRKEKEPSLTISSPGFTVSTKSSRRMASFERGRRPAGTFPGDSWMVILW